MRKGAKLNGVRWLYSFKGDNWISDEIPNKEELFSFAKNIVYVQRYLDLQTPENFTLRYTQCS